MNVYIFRRANLNENYNGDFFTKNHYFREYFMPNMIIKFENFGMKLNKSAKPCKNEKTQHQNGCFSRENNSKATFTLFF